MAVCGIAAVLLKWQARGEQEMTLAYGIDAQSQASRDLQELLGRMTHRGPDGTFATSRDGIALGMTRLSIVGGMDGQQPIWNEDGTIGLVCNGEIFNHEALRRRLVAQGHRFSTRSDVEVIVHLYELYGEAFVHHLRGIFALILWDDGKQVLLAARDKLGVKPLYYHETTTAVYLASELKALQAVLPELQGDGKGLALYHAYRYTPAPYTPVYGVYKLPPGFLAKVEADHLSTKPYWQPVLPTQAQRAQDKKSPDRRQRRATLRALLREAVAVQMAPGVPSGVLLSGGLDSTALLALQRELGETPTTWTVAFQQPADLVQGAKRQEYDELVEAQTVADHFGVRHHSERIAAKEVWDLLPQIIADLDDPVADPTALPLWFVCRMAKSDGARVVFSGEGLDELFAGYEVYRQVAWLRRLQRIPRAWRLAVLHGLERHALTGSGVIRRSLYPVWAWYRGVSGAFTEAESRELFHSLGSGFHHELESLIDLDPAQGHARQMLDGVTEQEVLTQLLYFDLKSWLPDNTLSKSDRISMAHGLELRVPFLDDPLVDFALQIPTTDKLRGQVGKLLVRQALSGWVPNSVLHRKKAGFPVPLTSWLFGEWKGWVQERLLDPQSVTAPWHQRAAVERLFRAEGPARRRSARLIWTLLTLELWGSQAKSGKSTGGLSGNACVENAAECATIQKQLLCGANVRL
ncbi:asparagine synthase (glutamine-hydrolyzing) [Alicyclobacillaceae bacterium I2511]|nr:asparagine synthase (glutamine-hydrolyzing) [Alicyclobacillaceae bacterium I2511]